MKHFATSVLAAALFGLLSNAASAQAKPEDAYSYRKSAYHVLVWNWMPLADMVRGKVPYDKAKFVTYSSRVAAVAPLLLDSFPKGSNVGKSEAKPEIWTKWADFSAQMKRFEGNTAALAATAKTGSWDQIKTQFGKVGADCKSCHDAYKAE
jgi:cytochrome c556